MSRSCKFLALFVLATLCFCPSMPAQSAGAQNPQAATQPGRTATNPLQIALTGCLKRSSSTGGYSIADQNGTTWELKSTSVNLAEHVNHSVTVTGKPVSQGAPQTSSRQESGSTQTGSKPQYVLRVLTLQLLSPSCTR